MTIRIGISGFGRIGRLVLRAAYEQGLHDVQIVGINNASTTETAAHLLKYDSVHGRFQGDVGHSENALIINGVSIPEYNERDANNLNWNDVGGVDVLMECTGKYTDRPGASIHLQRGAKKVLISAPATDDDLTVVYGVNHHLLKPEYTVVSNGSCTTNCLAPVAHVLHNTMGIKRGFMTTIHSYTGDQNLTDATHKDMHRARSAALSMVPTSTGAAKAIGRVIPELKGKLDGTAIRVPTPNVSMIDFKFEASRATSIDEINAAIKAAAADGPLKNVLGWYDEPLVSIDFNHNPHSAMFAVNETKVLDGNFVRVMAWYDNEWAFAMRMLDTAVAMMKA